MTEPAADPQAGGLVALVPRINIQAYFEKPQTGEALRAAFADRRLVRAHGSVHDGGIPAATTLFQSQLSPNLLIVESAAPREEMLASLAGLAEVCQPQTKVLVIGHVNDVILYRELIRQGVSEYVVAPVTPLQLIDSMAALYQAEKAVPVGRVLAFIGAKGGTGSSTVAHNVAWEYARVADVETAIIDLDIAFGTGALAFNTDTASGIVETVSQPARVDAQLLDRLLGKIGPKLSLLGGPGGLEHDAAISPHAVETLFTVLRGHVPMSIIDLPALWAPWVKFALLHADQVVITAEPELASLRNARALVDMLKAARPNDLPPLVLLNKTAMLKRPEIATADFSKAVALDVSTTIPFDPQSFVASLNNGKMLLEHSGRSKAAEALRKFAATLAGDKGRKPAASRSLLARLGLKEKS